MHRGNVVVVGNLGDVLFRGQAANRASNAKRTNRCLLIIFSLRLFFCETRNAPSAKLGGIKGRDGAYNAPRGKVWRKNKVSRTTAKR